MNAFKKLSVGIGTKWVKTTMAMRALQEAGVDKNDCKKFKNIEPTVIYDVIREARINRKKIGVPRYFICSRLRRHLTTP